MPEVVQPANAATLAQWALAGCKAQVLLHVLSLALPAPPAHCRLPRVLGRVMRC